MYLGYINDRQDLDFLCFKDVEDGKQISLILKTRVIHIFISTTIFINSRFMSDLELTNQSYSDKPIH